MFYILHTLFVQNKLQSLPGIFTQINFLLGMSNALIYELCYVTEFAAVLLDNRTHKKQTISLINLFVNHTDWASGQRAAVP